MSTVFDTATFLVQTRQSWDDEWTTQPDLQPIRGSIAADNNNQQGEFIFTRVYGSTSYPTEAGYTNRTPLILDNQWVRVTHNGNLIWQGRFLSEPRRINGNQIGQPSGTQTFVAYDGHTVLARMQFYGSTGIARNHDTNTNDTVNIDHVLSFNTADGGNRSAAKVTNTATNLDSYLSLIHI